MTLGLCVIPCKTMSGTWHWHHYEIPCKTMYGTWHWHRHVIPCKTISGIWHWHVTTFMRIPEYLLVIPSGSMGNPKIMSKR
ncbi:hypothetical protein F383_31224 [Gossypium arboreum]|uniref:Uncharacterized protein n=1 Tax=Gossypium arboreum TaxID=29729 RepID=A0A0B0MXI3_GOSAR|nr:hypothetical protein F383_31224 [Gossypium arboreum]